MGESTANWLGMWKEIWRVCRNDATLEVHVPHPRDDTFLIDPTNVRPVSPETIGIFDQMRNIRDTENGGQETKFGLMCGIDLEIVANQYDLREPWISAQGQ